ncbi:MAG: shikimate kinase [Longimicrobiales bacterium]
MSPIKTVVMIGFMGAGKTTVGQILARRLGWRFIDIDKEVERSAGMSIADFFHILGEDAFRTMERRVANQLCWETEAVVAPGGGWILRDGALESLPATARVVWLRVTPDEALRRVFGSATERPLLRGPKPLERARRIMAEREPLYAAADYAVDVDGRDPEDIAREVEILVFGAHA